ncbi:MAG: hypothetical protein HW388_775 [Dehalococcoidia bacterium]|nr:hypothetical protein [Dehalococcoidia bacterium]
MNRADVTPGSKDRAEEHALENEFGSDPTKEFGYKRAVAAVYLEIVIAVAVTIFSLYMALTGTGGFPGK